MPLGVLHLVLNPGLPDEQAIPLRDGAMTIGRTKDNDVAYSHKSLSRRHARVEVQGNRIKVTDLMSKNGLFFNGKRVPKCDVVEGDTFRCGDVSFLVEGATTRTPKLSAPAQTLPSPLALDPTASRRPTKIPPPVVIDDDRRYKDKLFVLIRASELLISELSLDRFLDELVVLAVQVLEVERIALLTFDDETAEMKPRAVKTFMGPAPKPYSQRVVDWVVDRGTPACWGNVSTDRSLPGDAKEDAVIKSAMCVPINPGGGTIGVLYADSVSRIDCYKPDDLALLRALGNLAAAGIECDAMRRNEAASSSE